jgi:hypothetical protein
VNAPPRRRVMAGFQGKWLVLKIIVAGFDLDLRIRLSSEVNLLSCGQFAGNVRNLKNSRA